MTRMQYWRGIAMVTSFGFVSMSKPLLWSQRTHDEITGDHYVVGQTSNHCSWTLCNHIDMKSGIRAYCSVILSLPERRGTPS